MIFIPYTSIYLQYTDIYGCKYKKKEWDWQAFKRLFSNLLFFFLGKWHVFPVCLFSHIKVFSRKKSQSLIFRLICHLYYWCTIHYKNDTFRFILQKISSKYHYFCRSIIKSPWCIIKKTRNYSQLNIEKLQLACSK